jgi:D-tagatose-1,6-bisphosphate aldolase subunit GatZ/KbaZ
MPADFLHKLVLGQKKGEVRGITSICSDNSTVLHAAFQLASQKGMPILVEASCNQVNQFGGHAGMNPSSFVRFIQRCASESGLSNDLLVLGGEHLGPAPWQNGPFERCMTNANTLVQDFVKAGFTKIHLDASMNLSSDDSSRPIDMGLAARRTAWLVKIAEKAAYPDRPLSYVIGSTASNPGGAQEYQTRVQITPVEHARAVLETNKSAFHEAGLDAAWERVTALVVQPGVDFGDDFIWDYNPEAARSLSHFSEETPLVYEVHSTDYQTRENLRDLVRDHFAILKVGPALTSAFRESVFALAAMEEQLFPAGMRSNIVQVVDDAMLCNPELWVKYYRGSPAEIAYKRKYSLSDRIRYYWSKPEVETAFQKLIRNLETATLPESLIGWFSPLILDEIHAKSLSASPQPIINRHIQMVLEDYAFACGYANPGQADSPQQ